MNRFDKWLMIFFELVIVVVSIYDCIVNNNDSVTLDLATIIIFPFFFWGYSKWLDYWFPKYQADLEFADKVRIKAKALGMSVTDLREVAYNDEMMATVGRIRQILHLNK